MYCKPTIWLPQVDVSNPDKSPSYWFRTTVHVSWINSVVCPPHFLLLSPSSTLLSPSFSPSLNWTLSVHPSQAGLANWVPFHLDSSIHPNKAFSFASLALCLLLRTLWGACVPLKQMNKNLNRTLKMRQIAPPGINNHKNTFDVILWVTISISKEWLYCANWLSVTPTFRWGLHPCYSLTELLYNGSVALWEITWKTEH